MKVRTAAFDPGGKNAIAPVIEALKKQGAEVGEDVEHPDVLLLGTSAEDHTPDKTTLAQFPNVPSVAVLDFWSNYSQRFSRAGTKDLGYLPTKVCVIDEAAKTEMVSEGFPADRLVITGNPHFDHFADAITSADEDPMRILFVSQAIQKISALPGYVPYAFNESSVLKDLIECISALPEEYYLSIRLHPKETRDKFSEYLSSRVRRAEESTLEEAISKSGLIVGMLSPVLMQAAAAEKKVLSYQPGMGDTADPLVSNRVSVTTRISTKRELGGALASHTKGVWPFTTRSLRDAWPSGATRRVLTVIQSLIGRTPAGL